MKLETIIETMKRLKYKVFENDSKNYNLNIVGIRTNDDTSNLFNDWLFCFWKYKGKWMANIYPITTDPGTYYRLHPMNKNGTWIMAPAQNIDCYNIGTYKGYTALTQIGPMWGYRDNDKDKVLDTEGLKLVHEIAATYIHKAGKKSFSVDNWSAGCQVFANEEDYNDFIETCLKSAEIYGNKFTYTLLTENQLNNKS